MHRFFVPPEAILAHTIAVTGDNYKHMKTVLRLTVKDQVILCDGMGYDYHCQIEAIQDQVIQTAIIGKVLNPAESKLPITLFQALPKLDKMELIIEKAVELGVTTIVPMITAFTVVKAQPDREQKKIARWNAICEAAAKQSGRGRIPCVQNICSYSNALTQAAKLSKCLIAYEKENANTLKSAIRGFTGENLGLIVGSEGGFSGDEIAMAAAQNIIPITLGKRILRTETAALAAVSMINYELEL